VQEAFLGILRILGACIPGFLLLYASPKFRFEEVVIREEPEQTAPAYNPVTTPNLRAPVLTGTPEESALRTLSKGPIYIVLIITKPSHLHLSSELWLAG